MFPAVAMLFADTYPRQTGVDALHYTFRLSFSDTSDELQGEASIDIRFLADGISEVVLDLDGMTVTAVSQGTYNHSAGRLHIATTPSSHRTDRRSPPLLS